MDRGFTSPFPPKIILPTNPPQIPNYPRCPPSHPIDPGFPAPPSWSRNPFPNWPGNSLRNRNGNHTPFGISGPCFPGPA